jgi:hypothetical protein
MGSPVPSAGSKLSLVRGVSVTVLDGFWPGEGNDMNTLRILGVGAMALAIVYVATPAAAQSPSSGFTPRPQGSPAASPEALEAATELVSLISSSMVTDLTSKVTAQAWPPIESSLRNRNPKIDTATIVALRMEFDRLTVRNILEIMNNAPTIYARYFTAQEIRDILAFYRTPTGAKTVKVMPDVTVELTALLMQDFSGRQQNIQQAFDNILRVHGYAR